MNSAAEVKKKARNRNGKNVQFRGDRRPQNGNNPRQMCLPELAGIITVIRSRIGALLIVAAGALVGLLPTPAHAQWWSRTPVDFEACADTAEKAPTKEEKTAALAECNAKFAGRRKPGGGYTYYDFMQDRTFDIAGPNPTPQEQKHIDEQYTAYLEKQRRNSIAAAFNAKQQQLLQQASLKTETERVPVPQERPKQQVTPSDIRARAKNCAKQSFSCEWPRLSEGLSELKKLFTSPPPSKAKRS
jgi:hypothetical protein